MCKTFERKDNASFSVFAFIKLMARKAGLVLISCLFITTFSWADLENKNTATGLVPLEDQALSNVTGQAGLTINAHVEGTLQSFQFSGPLETHLPAFYYNDGSAFSPAGYFPEDDDVGTNTGIDTSNPLIGPGPYWLPQGDVKIDDSDRTNDLFVKAGNWVFLSAPDGVADNPDYAFPAYFVLENITYNLDINNLTLDVDGVEGLTIGLPDITVTQLDVANIALKDDFYNDPSNRYPTISPMENSFGSLSISGQFNMGGSISVWGH